MAAPYLHCDKTQRAYMDNANEGWGQFSDGLYAMAQIANMDKNEYVIMMLEMREAVERIWKEHRGWEIR